MDKENFLIFLSSLAYKSNTNIKKELSKRGYNVIFIIKIKDIKFILVWENGELFIGIRGSTKSKASWLRNCSISLIHTPQGKFHYGFYKGARLMYDYLETFLKKGTPIYISGHSQGAAEAHILGLLLEYNGYNVKWVRSFAYPETISGKIYKAKFDFKKYYNNMDAIFRLPLGLLGYDNPLKNAIYITQQGDQYLNPDKTFIFFDRLKGLCKRGKVSEFFTDHSMDAYMKYLYKES